MEGRISSFPLVLAGWVNMRARLQNQRYRYELTTLSTSWNSKRTSVTRATVSSIPYQYQKYRRRKRRQCVSSEVFLSYRVVFPKEAPEPNSQGFLKWEHPQQAAHPCGHSLGSWKGCERSTWAGESDEGGNKKEVWGKNGSKTHQGSVYMGADYFTDSSINHKWDTTISLSPRWLI